MGSRRSTAALDGVSGTTAVHICFGYAAVVKDKPSGYSFLPELERSAVEQVSIEAAQPKLDLCDPAGAALEDDHSRRASIFRI